MPGDVKENVNKNTYTTFRCFKQHEQVSREGQKEKDEYKLVKTVLN